jgi:hypothetical protein
MASQRSDFTIDPKSIQQLDQLALSLQTGFNAKTINKALNAASLATARAMVGPVRKAAPVKTGRLRRAVYAQKVMKNGPGAYVGIKPGKNRGDIRGAYYRWIITAGVSRVPYAITPRKKSAITFNAGGVQVFTRKANRVNAIPGRGFVFDTVDRNINTAIRIWNDSLSSIIQAGIPAKGGIKVPKIR